MAQQKSIWLMVSALLLMLGCDTSFLSIPAPTPESLNIPNVLQIEPPGDIGVSGLVWSPDSTRLAISYSRTSMGDFSLPSSYQIQILDVKSGEKKIIEESNQGLRTAGAWLPDNRIAFFANQDLQEGTWLMNADGSGQKVLAIEGVDAAWSLDGTRIAFWESGGTSLPNKESIFVQNLGSGEKSEVFRLEEKFTIEGMLNWSPDGNRILFVLGVSQVSEDDMYKNIDLYLLDLASQNVQKLTDGGSHGSVSWSPEGRLIAYTYHESPGTQNQPAMYVMRSDGSCPVRLFEPGAHDVYGVSWSPDGHWIAFSWNGGIYLLDATNEQSIKSLNNGSACP